LNRFELLILKIELVDTGSKSQRERNSNRALDLDDALYACSTRTGFTICQDYARIPFFDPASGRGRDAPALVLSGSGTTYHVGLDRIHTQTHTHAICLRIQVELHYALPYVTAYPVAPHPPTGFVPAPTQPPTYGGKIDFPLTSINLFQVSRRFFHSLDFDSRYQKTMFLYKK